VSPVTCRRYTSREAKLCELRARRWLNSFDLDIALPSATGGGPAGGSPDCQLQLRSSAVRNPDEVPKGIATPAHGRASIEGAQDPGPGVGAMALQATIQSGGSPGHSGSIQCRSQNHRAVAPLAGLASMAERQAGRSVLRLTPPSCGPGTTSRVGRAAVRQALAADGGFSRERASGIQGRSPAPESPKPFPYTHWALSAFPCKGRPFGPRLRSLGKPPTP